MKYREREVNRNREVKSGEAKKKLQAIGHYRTRLRHLMKALWALGRFMDQTINQKIFN